MQAQLPALRRVREHEAKPENDVYPAVPPLLRRRTNPRHAALRVFTVVCVGRPADVCVVPHARGGCTMTALHCHSLAQRLSPTTSIEFDV